MAEVGHEGNGHTGRPISKIHHEVRPLGSQGYCAHCFLPTPEKYAAAIAYVCVLMFVCVCRVTSQSRGAKGVIGGGAWSIVE